MEITVNGRACAVDDGSTLKSALAALAIDQSKVAIAVNQTFVPKQDHADYQLGPGDRIDLISRIEGG